jgi:serine/threonine-protein kinase
MAPEQVARGQLDSRTDVFGLGAALYKVLTGRPMATDMNQTVSLECLRLVGKRVSDISQPIAGELAAPLERLIENCCQNDPAKRLSGMKDMKDRLEMCRTILVKREAAAGKSGPHRAQAAVSEPPTKD